MLIPSLISLAAGTSTLSRNSAAQERVFSAGPATLAGLALFGTACSSFSEAAPTTAIISLSSAAGAAAIVLIAKRFRRTPLPAHSSGVEAQNPSANGNGIHKHQKEMEILDMAIQSNPADTVALYARALAKEREKDPDGAIADFSRILEIEPKNVRALLRRGIAKCETGNYEGAIEDYNQVLELQPGHASAYFHRAGAKEGLEQWEEARDDYVAAKKRGGHAGIGIFADRSLRELEKRISAPQP